MQNVIVPQIQGNVAYPFDARLVLPILFGEENAIAPLQFAFLDVCPELDLCACGDVEYLSCALVKNILYK